MPSGGDWSLQRSAALFFEGTNRSVVERCVLHRLDGNGVMLSAFNQHANISHNTIVQTGGSAIAFWGNSSGSHPAQPPGTGPDGTAGNFPRHNLVEGNFITQLGIHAKQSSCFFQAKSAQTTLRRNLCFDVPRAGFNLNDGFGAYNQQGLCSLRIDISVGYERQVVTHFLHCVRRRQQHQRELAVSDLRGIWRPVSPTAYHSNLDRFLSS